MADILDGAKVWDSLNWPVSRAELLAEMEQKFVPFGRAVDTIALYVHTRDGRELTKAERDALLLLLARESLKR